MSGPSRREALAGALAAPIAATLSCTPAHARTGSRESGIATPPDLVVETPAGKVRGYRSGAVRIFKGIPFGASTAGANRFRPARPAEPWTGIRLALTPGPICPQPRGAGGPSPIAFVLGRNHSVPDEDCLSLNIWTPGIDDRRRPVMVWLHGGEFTTGSSLELAACDGEGLAARGDVVVVSLNHRLNLLGFLDLASVGAPAEFDAAANLGMLDIVLGLQWVRDAIARFGGDPGNVTVFGQSGGGLKVTTLCAMPSAAGLFHKAIVQSGSESHVFGREMTEPLARALLAEFDIAPANAARLQQVPIEQLTAAGHKVKSAWGAKYGGDIWKLVGWAPVIDGTVIPASPYQSASRRLSAPVPLLVGSTRHEFVLSAFSAEAEGMTLAQVRAQLSINFKDPDALIDAFAGAYPEERPVGLLAMISAASFNRANAVNQAKDKAALGGAPAFLYRFDWITPMLDGMPRAYHCAELPFVFHSIDKVPEAAGTGPRARAMAARVSDAWIAFARTGHPGHPGLPAWPAATLDRAPTMVFDDRCAVEDEADRALLQLVKANRKWA